MKIKTTDTLLVTLVCLVLSTQILFAKTAQELDKEVDFAIEKFKHEVEGGAKFLSQIKGYLLFPSVVRGGLLLGGKYGKGALRIGDKTKAYLSMSAFTLGLQLGVQKYSMLIAFTTQSALKNFSKSNGFEISLESSVSIGEWGASRDLSSMSFEKPIIIFVYGEKGVMAGVSLSGVRFEQITP